MPLLDVPDLSDSKPLDVLELGDLVGVGDPLGFGASPLSLVCEVVAPTDATGYSRLLVLNGRWVGHFWGDELTHIEYPDGLRRVDVGQVARVLYVPMATDQCAIRADMVRSRDNRDRMAYAVALDRVTQLYLATLPENR